MYSIVKPDRRMPMMMMSYIIDVGERPGIYALFSSDFEQISVDETQCVCLSACLCVPRKRFLAHY